MLDSLYALLDRIPPIDSALAIAVLVAVLLATVSGRRGGRFRGLPGWGGFWVLFALVLICLSRAPHVVSFTILGLLMFVALRAYFFVVPVRPRDHIVILATYVAVPLVLWPAFTGADQAFLAAVPVLLFLGIPVLLSLGDSQEGLLDSIGRTLLGVLFFVYCLAHLGLLVHQPQNGLHELFAILVLASELPQRLIGRFRPGSGWLQPGLGILASVLLAVGLGHVLGPWCGLIEEDAARAGFLVAVAVSLGALVSEAVARDLSIPAASALIGRGSFLNRMVPAVYAAPVFFHYLNQFA